MKKANTQPNIPTSWGELLDKISILEIKSEKIKQIVAGSNVRYELDLLLKMVIPLSSLLPNYLEHKAKLKVVNERLWDIEEALRAKEERQEFDAEFIALARQVYKVNDRRSSIKKEINIETKSAIVEEKSYSK